MKILIILIECKAGPSEAPDSTESVDAVHAMEQDTPYSPIPDTPSSPIQDDSPTSPIPDTPSSPNRSVKKGHLEVPMPKSDDSESVDVDHNINPDAPDKSSQSLDQSTNTSSLPTDTSSTLSNKTKAQQKWVETRRGFRPEISNVYSLSSDTCNTSNTSTISPIPSSSSTNEPSIQPTILQSGVKVLMPKNVSNDTPKTPPKKRGRPPKKQSPKKEIDINDSCPLAKKAKVCTIFSPKKSAQAKLSQIKSGLGQNGPIFCSGQNQVKN